jgi:iron(III) transport system substrate-binding protein
MVKPHNPLLVLLIAMVMVAMALSGCGSTPNPQVAEPPANQAAAGQAANGDLVEASKSEKDGLLVYSIMSEQNWAPVLAGFKARYPWINVTTADLGAYEVFERYYTEAAGNTRTADFIATVAPDGWIKFINQGGVLPYVSPEEHNLPEYARIAEGVYAVSTDPMVFIWNKALLPDPPATMDQLVRRIEAAPDTFQGRLVSYDAEGEGFGYGLNWYYTAARGDTGWQALQTLGQTRPRILTSGGQMIDSVLSGEAMLGYFVSLITVKPRLPAAEQLLGWSYVPDAQIVAVRPMAVTRKASSPASAKLLLDYILSAEGQIAFSQGGLTAYRPDVAAEAPLHLAQVSEAAGGEDALIFVHPDPGLADPARRAEFLARWKLALHRP